MKSNTMTSTATRRPRVIVYSNYPEQYFEKNIKSKLQAAGVDVQRVVNVDRSSSADLTAVDAVIAFVELMSSMQREAIKAKAKMAGRRFIGLTRTASSWPALLSNIQVIPDPTPSNVRRITGPVRPVLVEEAPPSLPVPEATVEDLRAMLKLFEEENVELNKSKALSDKVIKEREDRVLHFAKHFEEEKAKVTALEGRVKEQIDIRAQLEKDLTLAKENVDALARQVEAFKREGKAPMAGGEQPTVGSAAAYKAHHTRLKGDLFDANERIKKLEAELAGRPVTKTVQVAAAAPAPVFDKAILLAWLSVIRKAEKGDGQAYKGLLELAVKYGVDPATVLELVK